MPWKRGTGSVEVELSNVQSWIEQTDRVLNGENGEKGLIRTFQTDKDKQAQRDEDMMCPAGRVSAAAAAAQAVERRDRYCECARWFGAAGIVG